MCNGDNDPSPTHTCSGARDDPNALDPSGNAYLESVTFMTKEGRVPPSPRGPGSGSLLQEPGA